VRWKGPTWKRAVMVDLLDFQIPSAEFAASNGAFQGH
jgi:hypothetical protein